MSYSSQVSSEQHVANSERGWPGTCTVAGDTAAGRTAAAARPGSPGASEAAPSPEPGNSDHRSGLLPSRDTAAGTPSPRPSVHATATTVFFFTYQSWCASVCVAECQICNREVAGLNLGLGYFVPRSTHPSIPPWSANEYQLRLGRQRQVWLIPITNERVGVHVKL